MLYEPEPNRTNSKPTNRWDLLRIAPAQPERTRTEDVQASIRERMRRNALGFLRMIPIGLKSR